MSTSIARDRHSVVHRAAVPWLTVLPVAVLMSFADGYWMTSLRGAFGAIQRTQDPFGTWVRDSTVLVPAFVLAVLAALALSVRLFGPVLRARPSVPVTALFIALAGTVPGLVALGASTAYDYDLESSQLGIMATMQGRCVAGDCLGIQRRATLALQERSVVLGMGLILLTNLVLVGWVVAVHGGRLRVSATGRAGEAPRSRADDLRRLLAVGLVCSAVIHGAVAPEHLVEWPAAGAFFIALAGVELAVATLVVRRPRASTLVAAAASSLGPLSLWLCSRTVGLPFGPEPGTTEAVGLADVSACLLELATLAAAVALVLAQPRLRARRGAGAHRGWIPVMAVLTVTAIGFSGSGLAGFDGFGVSPTHGSTVAGQHH